MGWSCFPFLYKRNKNNLQSIKLYKNNNDNNIKLFTFWWSVSSARGCCYYLSFSPPPPFEISSLRPWPSPHPRHWGKFSGHHLPRDGSSKRERDITSRESFQGNVTLSSTLIFNFNCYKNVGNYKPVWKFRLSCSSSKPAHFIIKRSRGKNSFVCKSDLWIGAMNIWVEGEKGEVEKKGVKKKRDKGDDFTGF